MAIELVTVRRKICKQIQFLPQNLRFLSFIVYIFVLLQYTASVHLRLHL